MRNKASDAAAKFGVGEWYGYVVTALTQDERRRIFDTQQSGQKIVCPFKPTIDGSPQSCHKTGGVCSFRAYVPSENGVQPAPGDTGKFRVACPSRFLAGDLDAKIAAELIHSLNAEKIHEVGFLKSDTGAQLQPIEQTNIEIEGRQGRAENDVGRIDLILYDVDTGNWCAVEHQAVYFSGHAMTPEFRAMAEHTGHGLPMPRGRRPDYRSSGPKRLMPQLQIKVPTLRRWGKKMAVVIDESFFAALGRMDSVPDASSADIAWVIVEVFDAGRQTELRLQRIQYTTLERAVEGLTAGLPVTLSEFEARIRQKWDRRDKAKNASLKKLRKENPRSCL